MAAQACPSCARIGFTWSVDPDVGPLTRWRCSLCGYDAEEDESRESACPTCGAHRGRSLLADERSQYWFCFACRTREPGPG